MLSGLRGEDSIAELCRREGIVENLYYRWSKEFLEAGKKRLTADIGGSSGAHRRRGSPRPCRDRNRHQNSHAQNRSVRTPDGRSQGDQS